MMRSMYSGVAGLKTHQTKMDVIGNNIANVNTVAYKSQSVTFSELMYQTTQAASGANAATGRAGINARQIGLGVKTGAINTAISTQGASQTTNNPFDIRITGSNFFVVSDGSNTYFTRDGSFYVDGLGNLAMTSNGYNVMGWQVDPTDPNNIKQDTVSPLRIMSAENMTYPPESTTKAKVAGILDKHDTNVTSSSGKNINMLFYDNLGYSYTARLNIKDTGVEGQYTVSLADILDSENQSLTKALGIADISDIASFGSTQSQTTTELRGLASGYTYDPTAPASFNHVTSPAEALSDYKTDKMPGVSYSWPDGQLTAGATVTAQGSATLTKATLQTDYQLVYQPDTSNYYYLDSATGTGSYIPDDITFETFLGTSYPNAKNFTVTGPDAEGNVQIAFDQDFTVGGQDITIDSQTFSEKLDATVNANAIAAYGITDAGDGVSYSFDIAPDGKAQVTRIAAGAGNVLYFDTDTGKFLGIGGQGTTAVTLDFAAQATATNGNPVSLQNFSDISIDFSGTTMYNNSGTSTITASNGDTNNVGTGRKLGEMSGVTIQNDGRIYASYDNGMSRLLGQIATAEFANASGLAKEGDNLYTSTQNSGEFDGIGVEVTSGGGYMTTGVLEMSNVDLSAEFTDMITTQRGFQANSRIITVSDTLLEELVNLKR
ncbi:MAG: flagellar hook-basal body complex protein [Lachnospiraceae bacterium]|nr:flagellar hook-basal body complex protein [Candidatus Colinaster scatohippi]